MSDIVLGLILGVLVTVFLIYMYVRLLINKIMADLDNHVQRAVDTLMPINVERVNGEIYCYDDKNQFLCQAKTAAEIREIMTQRFPEKTTFLHGGDEDLVKELRAELKALGEVDGTKAQ